MIRSWLRLLPLLLLIACGILLLEGFPILTEPVVSGANIPYGTLIAWVGIFMFPLSILAGIRSIRKPTSLSYRYFQRILLVLCLLALMWGLCSYLLAGNWAFSFTDRAEFEGSAKAFKLFQYYTGLVIILPLILLIILGIYELILKIKKK